MKSFKFAAVVACFVFGLLFAQCSVSQAQQPTEASVLEAVPAVAVADGEVSRERVLAFKVALNQLAEGKRFRPLQALKLRRAANDDAVCEYLALKYQEELDEVAAEAVAGDQFMKWIEWVIKNQDSIIKFVTTLIDLFSSQTGGNFDQLAAAGPVSRAWSFQKATRARVRSVEARLLARLRG